LTAFSTRVSLLSSDGLTICTVSGHVFIVGSFRGLLFGNYLVRNALTPPFILINILLLSLESK